MTTRLPSATLCFLVILQGKLTCFDHLDLMFWKYRAVCNTIVSEVHSFCIWSCILALLCRLKGGNEGSGNCMWFYVIVK